MENKQTAVNWMANELLYLDNEYDMKLIDKNEYQARRKQVTKQAKQMEKEQIEMAHTCGGYGEKEAEEYFSETFKV